MRTVGDLEQTRWIQSLDKEPGHWKKQLPTKYLKIAERGNLEALQRFLQENPHLLNHRGPHGRTLLFEAARKGRLEVVDWLIQQGANSTLTGCYNSETLVQITPMCAAAHYGHPEVHARLAQYNPTQDIFRAAFAGDDSCVRAELLRQPALINAEDPDNEIYFNPLVSFAVAGRHVELTKWLVANGALVEKYGVQLLFIAAHNNDRVLVDFLISHGADPMHAESSMWMSTNDLGILQTLVECGLSANQKPYHDLTPLLYVCRADKGNQTAKIELLLELGADINAVESLGRSALHYAVVGKNKRVIELLINAGIDPTLRNTQGLTALEIAEQRQNHEAITVLKKAHS